MTPLALVDLTWHALVIQPLKRLLYRGSGLARFTAAYQPDGLRPTTAAEQETFQQAARCIGCGLCEAGGPLTSSPPLAALGRPAAFRLAGRRSVDAGAERALLEACAAAGSPAHCCPTGVPLDRVIEVLRGRPVAAAAPTG